jgi:hypothetical protein
MDELKAFSNSVGGAWAAAVSAVVGIAVFLPKILNVVKGDKIDGNVLTRLSDAEKNIGELNVKIQQHAIELTQVQMMLVQAVEHMEHHETPVPAKLAAYVAALKLKLGLI